MRKVTCIGGPFDGFQIKVRDEIQDHFEMISPINLPVVFESNPNKVMKIECKRVLYELMPIRRKNPRTEYWIGIFVPEKQLEWK